MKAKLHLLSAILMFDISAHRGDSLYFHENSAPAFVSAISKHAPSLEVDVIFTQDQKPIVYHDFKLDPEHFENWSGFGERDIRRLDFNQLRSLRYKNCSGLCGVLSLREFLTLVESESRLIGHEALIHLEVKHNEDDWLAEEDIAKAIASEIGPSELRQRITVRSFNYDILFAFKNLFPEFPRTLLVTRRWRWNYWAFKMQSPEGLIRKYGPSTIAPHHSLVDAKFIADWARHGVGVNPYTVNDAERARELIRLGVVGLTTDDPALMLRVAQEERACGSVLKPD